MLHLPASKVFIPFLCLLLLLLLLRLLLFPISISSFLFSFHFHCILPLFIPFSSPPSFSLLSPSHSLSLVPSIFLLPLFIPFYTLLSLSFLLSSPLHLSTPTVYPFLYPLSFSPPLPPLIPSL